MRGNSDQPGLPPGMPSPYTRNETLITLRHTLGLSQEEMARRIGVAKSTYEKWERGVVTNPTETSLAGAYALTNTTRREQLGFPAREARRYLPPVTHVMPADQLVEAAVAALRGTVPTDVARLLPTPGTLTTDRWIAEYELHRVRHTTRLVAGMDEQLGGGSVQRDTVFAALRDGIGLLRGRYANRETHTAMRAAVAELALTSGALLIDQGPGAYSSAQAALLVGLVAAPAVPTSRPAAATIRLRLLAMLARQALHGRDYRAATGILDIAERVAEATPPTPDVAAWLLVLRAAVAGSLDQVDQAQDLVTQAQTRYTQTQGEPLIDRGVFLHFCAFTYATLELCHGRARDQATDAFTAAIQTYGPHQLRSLSLSKQFRNMCMLSRGDHSEALSRLAVLLPDVRILSSALVAEAVSLTHLVPRVVAGDPATRPVVDLLHAYPPPVIPNVPQSGAINDRLRQDQPSP